MRMRPTQTADIPFVLAAENHSDNAPYITQCSKRWHEQAIASNDYAHMIVAADDLDTPTAGWNSSQANPESSPIGYIILAGLESPHLSLEIRRIVITQKGQGYGRAVLCWIKAFTFEQLGHHRLWLDVLVRNRRAKALYESEGFIAEGIIRDGYKSTDGYESMVLMSMLKNEYLSG